MNIRRTEKDDIPKLVPMLIKSFSDDPFYQWTFPDSSLIPVYFEDYLGKAIQEGRTYTTNGCHGVAIWGSESKFTANTPSPQSPPASPRSLEYLRAMQFLHDSRPDEAHFYLLVIATDPQMRRQGIGRLLVNTPPRFHDRKQPTYLEATTKQSVAFYKKIGFSMISTLQIPQGPPVWGMLRKE